MDHLLIQIAVLVFFGRIPSPDRRPLFAMFMAVAMSISAMAVLAKILLDLDVMKRDLGLCNP